MKITACSIDDRIRELKREGIKSIRWTKSEWKILKTFVRACSNTDLGYAPFKIKNRDLFMGLKHYVK